MARFLYRILRVANVVGSIEESQLRNAMRSSSVMQRLQSLIQDDLTKPLSYTLPLTGNAMAPDFNDGITDMQTARDRLIIRRLSGTTQSFLNRVHVDDFVVIRDPNDARRKYVRKITGLGGSQLVSKFEGEQPMVVPDGCCWVEKSNKAEEEEEEKAPDSSFFGPLGLENVVGRVMYAITSRTVHSRVVNSSYAMASDAIVMAQEPVSQYFSSDSNNESGNGNGSTESDDNKRKSEKKDGDIESPSP